MNFRLPIVASVLILILSGCASGTPTPQEDPVPEVSSETADFAIQTVKDRYEVDCLAQLGDPISYRFEPSTVADDSNVEGTVYASVGGDILKFSVGFLPNGGYLTVAEDSFSTALLESVGC
jgi:ABC-type Zn uptake system ZnuABC Zn-binding protein ZnuA